MSRDGRFSEVVGGISDAAYPYSYGETLGSGWVDVLFNSPVEDDSDSVPYAARLCGWFGGAMDDVSVIYRTMCISCELGDGLTLWFHVWSPD